VDVAASKPVSFLLDPSHVLYDEVWQHDSCTINGTGFVYLCIRKSTEDIAMWARASLSR